MSTYTDIRYSNSLLYPKPDYITSKYSIPTLAKGPSYESKPETLSYTNPTAAASYAASRGISSGIYKAPPPQKSTDPLGYMPSINNQYTYKRNDSYVPSNYPTTTSTIKQSDSILTRDNILSRDPNRRNIVPSPQAQNSRTGVSMERNYTKDYSVKDYQGAPGGYGTPAATYAAEKSGVYDGYGQAAGGYTGKFMGIDSRIKQPTPASSSSSGRKSTYGYQEPDEITMSTPVKNGKGQAEPYVRSNSRFNEPTNSSYMAAAAGEISAERGKAGSIHDRSIGGSYKVEERPFNDPFSKKQQAMQMQSNNFMGNSVVNPMAMAVAGKYDSDMYGGKPNYMKNEVNSSSKGSVAVWVPSEPKGLVGLRNIGNTCFMNSILQCLFNTPELANFIAGGKYMNEINYKREKGIARSFSDLLVKMRGHAGPPSYSAESTHMLKRRIEESNSMFSGYEQHDAQEFLKALLEGINEDLNRVSTKPPYKELTADVNRPLQLISNEWYDYMLGRDNSIITDLFSGQLLSRTTCTHCGYESLAFDNFWDLSLSFTRGLSMLNSCDLERMIEHFLKEELLDDMFHCAKCKQNRKFKKCFVIWRLPKVLVIHLKRFHYGKYKKEKITQNVKFPLQDLDLTEFVKESKDNSVRDAHYSLFAIVNHSGSLNGGHYTAECQNPFNRRWYNFNDSSVRESHALDDKCEEAEGESPYILFYTRK